MSDPTKVPGKAGVKDSTNGNAVDASLSDAELNDVSGGWPSAESIPYASKQTSDAKEGRKEKPYDFSDPSKPWAG